MSAEADDRTDRAAATPTAAEPAARWPLRVAGAVYAAWLLLLAALAVAGRIR